MKIIGHVLLVALFLFLVALTNLQAQQERDLSTFDGVSVTGNIEVMLKQADEEKVVVYAYGIPEEEVTTRVKNGILRVKVLNSIFYKNDRVEVHVYYKTLRGVKGFAGAMISSDEVMKADKLLLRAGSGSELDLEVTVNAIDAAASEGGVITLEGNTETATLAASTGAQMEALRLESDNTYVKASTGGQAEVVANVSIEASANTGGSIAYKGDPKEKITRTLMSGGIRKI